MDVERPMYLTHELNDEGCVYAVRKMRDVARDGRVVIMTAAMYDSLVAAAAKTPCDRRRRESVIMVGYSAESDDSSLPRAPEGGTGESSARSGRASGNPE